jgi:hypothetical protein
MNMKVAVPVAGSPPEREIDAGSGIVIERTGDGLATVYYEGNRFGYANVRTFADRVMIAAGRAKQHAPTVATMVTSLTHLVVVGEFDGDRVQLYDEGYAPLCEWLGRNPDDGLGDELEVMHGR